MPDSEESGLEGWIPLGTERPIWNRFFQVAPLVVVGTREPDGSHDLAPKHMVTALGWQNYVGFVCTPRHATYRNARREGVFTLSFPRPSQVLSTSLAAAPRCEDDEKPSLGLLETIPAPTVDGVLLREALVHLECETDRIVDGFGENSLIAGRVVQAWVADDALRRADTDDADLLQGEPLLAYVAPGRWAKIAHTDAFPFHEGWSR